MFILRINLSNTAKTPPRFFMRAAKWGSRCAGCDFVDHGYATIEGARAGWARATR